MKYPKHLTLDLGTSANSRVAPYWVLAYSNSLKFQLSNAKLINFNPLPASLSITPNPFKAGKAHLGEYENPLSTYQKINIVFLRKERIYTKLKYSRCPQYDMVSGGMAALFSAFLGFLITEKFGLELLDSGDFYIAFMYGVFAVFSLRPFLKVVEAHEFSYRFFSLKFAYTFYSTILFSLLSGVLSWLKVTEYPQNILFRELVSFFWRHEYILPTIRWVRGWIKFLKNYPRDSE